MNARELIDLWRRTGGAGVAGACSGPLLVPTVRAGAKPSLDTEEDETLLGLQRASAAAAAVQAGPAMLNSNAGPVAPAMTAPVRELREGRELVVGRSRRCDVSLVHASISRHHAVLAKGARGWELTDRESRNGTKVNGRPLAKGEPRLLASGDLLSFGDVELVFCGPEPADVDALLAPRPR